MGTITWTGDISVNWESLATTPSAMLNWVMAGAPLQYTTVLHYSAVHYTTLHCPIVHHTHYYRLTVYIRITSHGRCRLHLHPTRHAHHTHRTHRTHHTRHTGAPFIACDIGGFEGGNTPADLLTRWYQLGTFMPIFRVHSRIQNTPHFPWLYGANASTAMRAALNLRYRLLPMTYSLAHRVADTGTVWWWWWWWWWWW
jgi:hypothetical protein